MTAPIDFAWRIAARDKIECRLQDLGIRTPLKAGERFAQLFAWRGVEYPQMLAWTALDDALAKVIAEEDGVRPHPYARWLTRQPQLGMWTIAMGWTFYWHFMFRRTSMSWERQMRRSFEDDPWLDSALSPSRGWLLWDFQLQLLAESSIASRKTPSRLAEKLRKQDPNAMQWLARARLPSGLSVHDALLSRGYPLIAGTLPFCGPMAARIHGAILRGDSDPSPEGVALDRDPPQPPPSGAARVIESAFGKTSMSHTANR